LKPTRPRTSSVPPEKRTGQSSSGHPLSRPLCRRYEKASLVLTSNKSFLDWGDIFGDQVLASAILDRLLHHATTVNIKGESYRLKEKRRAGLLESKALPPEEQEPLEVPI
jgi:hypothetical protein